MADKRRKSLSDVAEQARKMAAKQEGRAIDRIRRKRGRQWEKGNPVAGLRLSADVVDRIEALSQATGHNKSAIAEALLTVAIDALDRGQVELGFEVEHQERESVYQWKGQQVKRSYQKEIITPVWDWACTPEAAPKPADFGSETN